jgi:hypothetical protein
MGRFTQTAEARRLQEDLWYNKSYTLGALTASLRYAKANEL